MKSEEYNKLTLIQDYWIDPDNCEMWIHGVYSNIDSGYTGDEPGIEYMMATKVIKNLHFFRHKNVDEITVHLHTNGGIWEEGMAIYDAIKSMPYEVTIINYTHAKSMSSIIFQAADNRIMMPHSYFMFHYGGLCIDGDEKTVISDIEFSKKCTDEMINIYLERASKGDRFKGKDESNIRKAIISAMDKKGNVYLIAEEAIDWGFADEILDEW